MRSENVGSGGLDRAERALVPDVDFSRRPHRGTVDVQYDLYEISARPGRSAPCRDPFDGASNAPTSENAPAPHEYCHRDSLQVNPSRANPILRSYIEILPIYRFRARIDRRGRRVIAAPSRHSAGKESAGNTNSGSIARCSMLDVLVGYVDRSPGFALVSMLGHGFPKSPRSTSKIMSRKVHGTT
jgi:hypothetical protein